MPNVHEAIENCGLTAEDFVQDMSIFAEFLKGKPEQYTLILVTLMKEVIEEKIGTRMELEKKPARELQ